MDYSASIQDDNPAGASPWGSSPTPSPQHTGFGTSNNDIHSSPYRDSRNSNGSYGSEGAFGGPLHPGADPSVKNGGSDNRPGTADSTQTGSTEYQSYGEQQRQQAQALPPTYNPAQTRHDTQRGQPAARQGSHPQASQYKLQAKITSLERTGRKDPVLRFDVYVGSILSLY